jgi:hypothetical protein
LRLISDHINCLAAKAAIAMILAVASVHTASAQMKTLGTSWSLSGIGVFYEKHSSAQTFIHISVQAEMGEMFRGTTPYSGLSAAFTWNHIFAQVESRNGTPVQFYAGPGIAAGASKDFDGPRGLFFGLKGRLGVQCLYKRKVNISVAVAPVIGIQLAKIDENFVTRAYRNGLLHTIVPEIGISYRF